MGPGTAGEFAQASWEGWRSNLEPRLRGCPRWIVATRALGRTARLGRARVGARSIAIVRARAALAAGRERSAFSEPVPEAARGCRHAGRGRRIERRRVARRAAVRAQRRDRRLCHHAALANAICGRRRWRVFADAPLPTIDWTAVAASDRPLSVASRGLIERWREAAGRRVHARTAVAQQFWGTTEIVIAGRFLDESRTDRARAGRAWRRRRERGRRSSSSAIASASSRSVLTGRSERDARYRRRRRGTAVSRRQSSSVRAASRAILPRAGITGAALRLPRHG